ncbi:DUF86 domain-containing protein [Methylocystis sp. ATCC 49242]|uniref:type VII toxin-antitoxin system HepT family RNase toxin n=1 Tax=Methylocystis sp. ATCC 49242 TaxID=622637 RepID=UPI001FCB5C29|nr:DUF86 domain-containing protein [Methylocystis sp. ATCC 49242]
MQRACEAALDMGQHVVRRERLGAPQSARDVFTLLVDGGRIAPELAENMRKTVGFRNIAVHDYQALVLPIVTAIITGRLDDFLAFSAALLKRSA